MTDIVQGLGPPMARRRSQHILVSSEICPAAVAVPTDPAQTATTAAQVTHGEHPRRRSQGGTHMTMTADVPGQVPWWKEPTKDQWVAWVAAWLGWTLDAFDFTIFLLLMVPIAETFHVPLVEVAAVFTITLWLRLVGAVGSGWLSDRIGRKTPLMMSILWYSICNFAAGLSPTFALLFLFRALLGIGMGAEWPAGA